ncbi:Arc family DNA-binding protein [Variovorax sp. IB41]|uniref:Arc family DNA-binding protein n=1 Tax=Variovorax sp. IB41 TaxID=2779370 RepID=UPI0018E8A944|nr:Arc family DNA-binding protein [Variovorax sp. IB41]
MRGNSKLAPSPVRLPQDLKNWLKHQAIDNKRSMNGEVVARLEESRARQGSAQQPVQGPRR